LTKKILKIIPLRSKFRKCTLYAHALATLNPPLTCGSRVQINDDIVSEARPTIGNIGSRGIQTMSEKQLACNPFVMKLMKIIALLEGCQNIVPIEAAVVTTKKLSTEVVEDGVEPVVVAVHTVDMEVSEKCSCLNCIHTRKTKWNWSCTYKLF
jgi:hypothetical protein